MLTEMPTSSEDSEQVPLHTRLITRAFKGLSTEWIKKTREYWKFSIDNEKEIQDGYDAAIKAAKESENRS